jgi:uncharacterized protein (DUF697 family)
MRMSEQFDKANATIKRFSLWSAGFGLIPLPLVDIAMITGTQVKLVHDLAKIYGREFSEERVRTAIGALVGAVLPVAVGTGAISALKAIPIIGQITGVLLVPALAAASTIAVGRVFVQHFETGGTLLDFDPEAMKAHYQAEFEAAKGKAPATPPAATTPPAAATAPNKVAPALA